MKKSLIPWHVFLEAIARQEPWVLESWLRRWGFKDDGVLLLSTEHNPDSRAQASDN